MITVTHPSRAHVRLQVLQLVSDVWQKDGLIKRTDSAFLREAARILKNSLELVTDAGQQLRELLDYPLAETVAEDEKAQAVLDDNFSEVRSSSQGSMCQGSWTHCRSLPFSLYLEKLIRINRLSLEFLHTLWNHGMHTLVTCAYYLRLRAVKTPWKRTMTQLQHCPLALPNACSDHNTSAR